MATKPALRILVVARDRQFRRMAQLLFERHGWVVSTSTETSELVELVSERAVDVIVVDASSAITPVARTADALRALAWPVGVVMVGDGPEPAKWGPFEALTAAAERAYLHSRAAAWSPGGRG